MGSSRGQRNRWRPGLCESEEGAEGGELGAGRLWLLLFIIAAHQNAIQLQQKLTLIFGSHAF